MDSASVAAKGGEATGPNPTDQGRPGRKRHLLTDRAGLPLAVLLTGPTPTTACLWPACWTRLCPCRAGVAAPAAGPPSCTPTRPTITTVAPTPAGLGASRPASRAGAWTPASTWAATAGESERTHAWLASFRRLAPRYERRLDIHHAFTALACALVCFEPWQTKF